MVDGALKKLKLLSRYDQELKTIVSKFIKNTNTKLDFGRYQRQKL